MSSITDQTARDEEAISRFGSLTDALNADVSALFKLAEESATPMSRRSAVRAALAAIEGLISATKGLIVVGFPRTCYHFTDAEVAMLREESYALTDKGDAIVRT